MRKRKRHGGHHTRRSKRTDPVMEDPTQGGIWGTKIVDEPYPSNVQCREAASNPGPLGTRRSHKNKRSCNAGAETTGLLISGDSRGDCNQDILTKLSVEVASDVSKSVVSVAVSNEGTVLFACSGVAIRSTRFLTSASLVRAFNDAKEYHDNLKIEVCHEGNEVRAGFLAECNSDHNFAVVDIIGSLDVHRVLLKRAVDLPLNVDVIAVGRSISGEVITKRVKLATDSSRYNASQRLTLTKYGISEALKGGPLFDFDGNFVGMNCYLVMETTYFVHWSKILEWSNNSWASLRKKALLKLQSSMAFRVGRTPVDSNSHQEVCSISDKAQFGDLDPNGYPRPPVTPSDSVILVNSFEETFGYKCGDGVWSEVNREVSSNINRYVVALASFSGETRVFACTGFVIEWKGCKSILTSASLVRDYDDENNIIENLRIDVLLSDRRHRQGTLLHYNLHYNVALVSVEDCRAILAADVQPQYEKCSGVLAVGRCFKSGLLMAVGGQLVSWTGTLDCGMLGYSSCRITKAGIGGPLVDADDGKIVGMNFYDQNVGTPLLIWNHIQIILNHFENISTCAEVGNDTYQSDATSWRMDEDKGQRLNRWPVPKQYFRHPDDPEPQEEDEPEPRAGFFDPGRFEYIHGMKIHLF